MTKVELFLELTSTPRILSKVRSRIRKYAETIKLPASQIDNLELAVDEAVSNVILHAYPERTDGPIQLRVWQEREKVLVAIRDFGKGYQPKPVSMATIKRVIKQCSRGGMGRYIMKVCMDSVRYTSLPRKYNETLMVKKISRKACA